MHIDDRLATVLRLPVSGEGMARNQFRQLLDLLGMAPVDAAGPQVDAAFDRLSELARMVPAADRARIAGDPAVRLRSPRLVSFLAEAEPAVASAAIRAARLDEEQWLDLVPALPVGARGILRQRPSPGPRVALLLDRLGVVDRGLPPAATPSEQVVLEAVTPEPVALSAEPSAAGPVHFATATARETVAGIGDIVRRIEAFRKSRERAPSSAETGEAQRVPPGDGEHRKQPLLAAIDFSTDIDGRITWSDPVAAPMVVGLRIAAQDPDSPALPSAQMASAFRFRQPMRACRLRITGADAVSGDWQADAAPRFDLPGGSFAGYAGRLRRLPDADAQADAAGGDETDRMRQILHELRTPVNAVQGFAEVIQQQLFGPVPHEYRALAASVASDAARVLAGLEELDRLVKLDCAAMELDPGESDLARIVAMTVEQICAYTEARRSGFVAELEPEMPAVAMMATDAERLVWRLLATLAGETAPGERLRLRLHRHHDAARLDVALPAALAKLDDAALFHAAAPVQPRALAAGMFGTGFALRLATTEAKAAGGRLVRNEATMLLELPVIPGEARLAPPSTRP